MLHPYHDEHIQSLLSEATQIGELQSFIDKRLRGPLSKDDIEELSIEIIGRLMFIKSSLNRRVYSLRNRRD